MGFLNGGNRIGLESLFSSLAKLDFTTPFGFENLRCGDPATGLRIEDGIDDVTATCLAKRLGDQREECGMATLTRCNDSIG